MTFKLSPSGLKLLEECPRCFWLTQHKLWKRPLGPFPSLPSGMDRILKNHFNKFRDKGELPPELCENSHCKDMKLFDDKTLLNEWQNNLGGISWTDNKGNIFFGAVDNILQKGKKLIVLDYKTRGFPLKEDTAGYYKDQLDVYNFLLRKNGYETEDFAFLLFYIPKEVIETGEFVFDTELVKMKVDVKNAQKIINRALEILNGDCPEKNDCEWCEGAENG